MAAPESAWKFKIYLRIYTEAPMYFLVYVLTPCQQAIANLRRTEIGGVGYLSGVP